MHKSSSLRICLLVILAAGSGSSCVLDRELDEHIASNQMMSFEEFEAQAYRESDTGVYIVNGDTPLENIEQLREFYNLLSPGALPGTSPGTSPGALVLHQDRGVDAAWTALQKVALTYCVSTNFGFRYNQIRQMMEDATRAWEAVARVDFIHLPAEDTRCSALNTRVVFDVREVSGEPYLARAFFPNFARSNRNVLIDTTAYGDTTPYTLTGILRHELGHTLGFRHEHTRPEAGTCFEDTSWRPLTPYDPSSVMHYPWCNGGNIGDLDLTLYDKRGARLLYGAWPEHLLLIDENGRGGTGERLIVTDFSDAQPPAEVSYQMAGGDSDLLNGWLDQGDVQLSGDFLGLGYEQAMFINHSTAGSRLMIVGFRQGRDAEIHHVEAYGQSTVLDGWHDPGDLILAGDFLHLGYDQVMFINRAGRGGDRVLIADFKDGAVPAAVRYREVAGQSNLLDGWYDDGDLHFVGDFMALGHDQVLFINRAGHGGGRVLIADFSAGVVPATALYREAWNQSKLLDGYHDRDDIQLAGDFMNLDHDQLLFINTSGGGGRVLIADFSAGVVPATALYREAWNQSALLDGWHDPNDLRFAGDFVGLGYDQVMFVNTSGGGGKIMVADFSVAEPPAQVLYYEVWGQSTALDGFVDAGDVQLVGDFHAR